MSEEIANMWAQIVGGRVFYGTEIGEDCWGVRVSIRYLGDVSLITPRECFEAAISTHALVQDRTRL